jgi:hypothetical protein
MGSMEAIERVEGALTAEQLAEIISALARERASDRSGVPIHRILTALASANGFALDAGPAGWEIQVRLTRLVRKLVDQIPEMRYIEGDA